MYMYASLGIAVIIARILYVSVCVCMCTYSCAYMQVLYLCVRMCTPTQHNNFTEIINTARCSASGVWCFHRVV